MKKIILLCNQGLSSSALVKNMRDVALRNKLDYEIAAHSIENAENCAKDADVILLGPQIRYKKSEVEKMFPNKPVEVIDMASYGMLDGKKVLIQARKIMRDQQ